jgi:hypothetical protein
MIASWNTLEGVLLPIYKKRGKVSRHRFLIQLLLLLGKIADSEDAVVDVTLTA